MFIYVLAKIQVLSLVNVVCNIFQSYTFLLTPDENVKKTKFSNVFRVIKMEHYE